MDILEVVPGRDIGKLHILKKVGSMNGEDCYLCRDEKGRNIQFVESKIIDQAGEGSVIEEPAVEPEVPEQEEVSEEPEEEVPGDASVEMTEEMPEVTEEVEEAPKEEAPKEEDNSKRGFFDKKSQKSRR